MVVGNTVAAGNSSEAARRLPEADKLVLWEVSEEVLSLGCSPSFEEEQVKPFLFCLPPSERFSF
jgi:hypothetical protein